MSFIPLGVSAVQLIAQGLLSQAFFIPRSIAGFVADITVEEDGTDELAITDFPVEVNANITDHAFLRPSRVKVLVGYSNSSLLSLGNPNYVQNIYTQFLALQASREPFDIFTGKRVYTSMLLERLHQHTDQKLENALLMTCECRQIILTSTQTTSVPPSATMKNPEITAPTTNGGDQSLQPGTQFNSSAASAINPSLH